MVRQFILTEDGSHTIFVPEMGEHYHSVHGACQESLHIFIRNGYEKIDGGEISILEMGFGTGLNAFLTLLRSVADSRKIYYEGWEAYPISAEESGLLNYPQILQTDRLQFDALHAAEWESEVQLTPEFSLKKVRNNFLDFNSSRMFDLVYFDAFGPDYQPGLWTAGVFKSIAIVMKTGSRLVTYSAKGQVRRNLKEAGLRIEKAPGPPGKREITIAIKD